MIYRWKISIPKNTLEGSKLKTTLKMERGVVHQIDIVFPSGPVGLAHIQINRGLHQVWPTNASGSFAADNTMISFKEYYEIISKPLQLEAYTWNLDDTYDHSIIIRIGILERRYLVRRFF